MADRTIHRYTEMIDLLYSYPDFNFGSYNSLLTFSLAIPTPRFRSIRGLRIFIQPNQPTQTPRWWATYENIRHLEILNSPRLPYLPPEESSRACSVWIFLWHLVAEMDGLKSLEMRLSTHFMSVPSPSIDEQMAKLESRGLEVVVSRLEQGMFTAKATANFRPTMALEKSIKN